MPCFGNGKVYEMVVRPAVMYGLEMLALTKRRRWSWRWSDFIGGEQNGWD